MLTLCAFSSLCSKDYIQPRTVCKPPIQKFQFFPFWFPRQLSKSKYSPLICCYMKFILSYFVLTSFWGIVSGHFQTRKVRVSAAQFLMIQLILKFINNVFLKFINNVFCCKCIFISFPRKIQKSTTLQTELSISFIQQNQYCDVFRYCSLMFYCNFFNTFPVDTVVCTSVSLVSTFKF